MESRKLGERCMLRFEVGEEIIETIKKFCIRYRIRSGNVTGIGVLRMVRNSYFYLALKDYHHRDISELMKQTSSVVNISMMERQAFPHLNVTLSDAKFKF